MAVATGLAGANAYGSKTATADTVITPLIEPIPGSFTRIRYISYTAQGTAHTLTVMRPLSKCRFSAAAAASQAVVNVDINPGNYSGIATGSSITPRTTNNLAAANDFVAYQAADGTWVTDTISSISSLAITLTTNVPTGGVPAGGTLWWFGIITDVNPNTAVAHPQFALASSAATTFGSDTDVYTGWLGSVRGLSCLGMTGLGEPMILHSGNATAAGTFNRISVLHTLR